MPAVCAARDDAPRELRRIGVRLARRRRGARSGIRRRVRVARLRHLDVRLRGDRLEARRRRCGRGSVHRLRATSRTCRRDRARPAGAARERALERMRMHVRHRRHQRARERLGAAASAFGVDRDDRCRRRRRRSRRARPAVGQQRCGGEVLMRPVDRRATSATAAADTGLTCEPCARHRAGDDERVLVRATSIGGIAGQQRIRTLPTPRSRRKRRRRQRAAPRRARRARCRARDRAPDHEVEVARRTVEQRAVERASPANATASYGARTSTGASPPVRRMPLPASSTSVRSTPGNARTGRRARSPAMLTRQAKCVDGRSGGWTAISSVVPAAVLPRHAAVVGGRARDARTHAAIVGLRGGAVRASQQCRGSA